MVDNIDVIPKIYINFMTCFVCKNFLRNPMQCSSCKSNYCIECITNLTKKKGGLFVCKGNKCLASFEDFQPVSRLVINILD